MFKKILLIVATVFAVLILLLVGFIALQPSEYSLERSATIDAPIDVLFAQVDDLRRWEDWSPWAEGNPVWETTYEGPDRGEGASFAWDGDSETGSGRMTITESRPHEYVEIELEFFEPFESTSTTAFSFTESDEGKTYVTWSMWGDNTFMSKAFGLFFDIEDMVGGDYERGLANLDEVARAAAEEQAPPEAAEREVVDTVDWRSAIADNYRHFHSVEIDERPIEDTFHQGCDRIAEVVGQQMLFADLSHDDERVFASQSLRIAPLDEGVDVYSVYLTDEPPPDFCVSKASHIAVHWGDWFAELEVVCRAAELVHYEIGDFLGLLSGVVEDTERPEKVLVSHCGQMKMEAVSFEELLQNAGESRQLWGQSYPERREQ